MGNPQRFSAFNRFLMYAVLVIYGCVSVLPFFFMLMGSLMTLPEAMSGSWLPKNIKFGSDITNCIIFAKDKYANNLGQIVTETRWSIDVPESAAAAQQYGTGQYRDNYLERQPIFSLPFFTNYCAAWQGGNLGKHIWNTVKLAAIQVTGTVIFCTLAAYAFARIDFIGREPLFAFMLSTLMIPAIVQNLPNFLIVNEIGRWSAELGKTIYLQPMTQLYGVMNWETVALNGMCNEWRNCWIDSWPALTIPFLAPTISIFLLRQHFATIPQELWDAARIDGADHLRFLLQVVVPLSRAPLLVTILFAFIGVWNELAWAILVTSSDEWRPIGVGLSKFLSDEAALVHLRLAGSTIAIIPILFLYGLTQRQFIEGLSQSGLKG